MNTIKIFLAESGRIADLKKDFPLYQGQFQNKLLNVFVPTSIVAPSYTSQNADGVTLADYVASTSVKIGMSYTARNGTIKVSKNYYMRFLKTLTYQNVEYALYERKLPKEFTLYAGQGANAPILTANVVNIQQETESGKPIILSVITSQTCSLDVMPSTSLDNDEAIEPTELENINAQLNEINGILPTKQDKTDNTLETTNKSVVGAINENKGRIDINTQNIETNRQNIAKNRNDIDYMLENFTTVEDYIGQLTGTSLPTSEQLTAFVRANTSPSREPKNADVVIFVLQVQGGTDKNYKYIYSTTGWNGYEIPPMEMASNGTLGILKGTYGIGSTNDTLIDISGGEILNIYVKDNTDTYRNIREYLNTATTNIDNIISGNTSVGLALRSIADGLGNNIVNTYLTQTLGATKQYVRDYAMPREFNDVYFIATAGYLEQVPATPESGIQFTTTTNAVADFQLFQIQKTNTADFELSSKNGYSNNIYVSASANCRVTFRLTTQYKKLGQDWSDLNVELTSPINLVAGDVEKIIFGNPFTSLGENVISLTNGDLIRQTLEVVSQTSETITFNVYSNDIYPSTFNLTSQSYVLSKALITPTSAPSNIEIVAIDNNNSQIMLELGDGLYVVDGQLKVSGGGSAGTTNYQDLDNKPILNSNNTTSQTPNASETINGTINLHKVSKTGALADAIQDSTHRTVTDSEKADWNNTNFSRLTNVPQASTGVAGIIQIATDNEAETGTDTTKAINPKQLKTAIDGLGSVFTLKGSVENVAALPSTGNEIGDVYYVVSENVGYIWLNDGTTDRWEQLGLPIDLSGYVQFTDIINTLNSTASDKPLSALQGKNLNDMITSLQTADGQNVKITGNQSVSGTKNFTGTFQIGGKTISYDSSTDTFSI